MTTNLSDRDTLRIIRTEAADCLKELGDRLGVDFALGNCTFDGEGTKATFQLKCSSKMSDEEHEQRARDEFRRSCALFGVGQDMYKAQFEVRGETYEILGFELGRSKYPVRARNVKTGKVMLYTQTVLERLQKVEAPKPAAKATPAAPKAATKIPPASAAKVPPAAPKAAVPAAPKAATRIPPATPKIPPASPKAAAPAAPAKVAAPAAPKGLVRIPPASAAKQTTKPGGPVRIPPASASR